MPPAEPDNQYNPSTPPPEADGESNAAQHLASLGQSVGYPNQPTPPAAATPAPINDQPPVANPAATNQPSNPMPGPANEGQLNIQNNVSQPITPAVPAAPADVPETKENIYTEICSQIIKEQEQIIGGLALEEADHVEGLTVDHNTYHCTVTGDGSKVIDDLIGQYRDFFGHAAVEVCKEAAAKFINRLPAEALPLSLR